MEKYIGAVDYVVLVIILLISILIGIYHGFKNKIHRFINRILKRNPIEDDHESGDLKTKEYLTANSSMGLIPVAFSLLASFVSGTSFLGTPAEVYQYGLQTWMSIFGIMVTPLFGAFITGPFFLKLKIFSVYEYLELRYNTNKVRLVGSCCYIIKAFIASSLFMYGPATALSALTGLDENVSIGLIGVIGTTYTSLGGIRGVIWTDLYQALIMYSTLFMIVIKGMIDVGGFDNLFRINDEGGRLYFANLDPDPFVRQNVWAQVFGNIILFTNTYALDQQMIQRFQAAKSKKFAQTALLLNIPGQFISHNLCILFGMIIYALYAKCDPLTKPMDKIANPNQLTGYFVMNSLSQVPGLAGLFLASLFCGSLSSISSVVGSQAALVWEDLFKSFKYFRKMNDTKSLIMNKIIVLVCGAIGTCLAFVIASIGGNLSQISASLNGAFGAPIIGLFILSFFFPTTNVFGIITGIICGFSFVLWLSLGAMILNPYYPGAKLNVSIEECPAVTTLISPAFTSSYFGSTTTLAPRMPLDGFNKFYSLSFLLYSASGVTVVVLVGFIASLISGGYKLVPDQKYLIFNIFWFLPKYKQNKVEISEKEELKLESKI